MISSAKSVILVNISTKKVQCVKMNVKYVFLGNIALKLDRDYLLNSVHQGIFVQQVPKHPPNSILNVMQAFSALKNPQVVTTWSYVPEEDNAKKVLELNNKHKRTVKVIRRSVKLAYSVH